MEYRALYEASTELKIMRRKAGAEIEIDAWRPEDQVMRCVRDGGWLSGGSVQGCFATCGVEARRNQS